MGKDAREHFPPQRAQNGSKVIAPIHIRTNAALRKRINSAAAREGVTTNLFALRALITAVERSEEETDRGVRAAEG